MKLKGFDEFEKIIQGIKNDFPDSTETFMKQQAERLKKDVKEGTPVKKGLLKISWQRTGKGSHGTDLKQTIFNNTDYANHVEYGHRTGKGRKKFVKGRFMLRKAVDKRRIEFYRDLEKCVEVLMKK